MTDRVWLRGGIERVTVDEYGRWYVVNGKRLWSVTKLLKDGMPEGYGLAQWKRRQPGIAAVKYADKIATLLDGEDVTYDQKGEPTSPGAMAAFNLVVDYSESAKKQAALRGSLLHDYAEAHVLDAPMPPVPDDVARRVDQFLTWLDVWQPRFVAVEAVVYSETQQYAGTLDFIADFDRDLFSDDDIAHMVGPCFDPADEPAHREHLDRVLSKDTLRLLGDYKTGKRPYTDAALQMAAYRWADAYFALPDSSGEPLPDVDGAVVIHVTDDGYAVHPVWTEEPVFAVFTYIREVFRWEKELWKYALGKPVKNPTQQRLPEVAS